MDDSKSDEHPAYGAIAISHIHGGDGRLFGSPIDRNPTRICLRISHCKLMYDLYREWFFPTDEIIEVELSPAQFVDLITNPNRGSGVPCTITRMGLQRVEELPVDKRESQKVRDDFKKKTDSLANGLSGRMNSIKEILDKKSLTKKDRKEITDHLQMIMQDIRSNMPFVLQSFEEATAKVTNHSKAEISAMWQMLVEKTGLKALQDMGKDHLLEDKKDEP